MLSTLEALVTILSAGEEGEQGTGNVPGGGGSAVRFGGLVPQIDVFLSISCLPDRPHGSLPFL